MDINTNSGDKFFRKWSLAQPTDSLMIQDEHQYKSHQDLHIHTGGGDKLFATMECYKAKQLLDES